MLSWSSGGWKEGGKSFEKVWIALQIFQKKSQIVKRFSQISRFVFDHQGVPILLLMLLTLGIVDFYSIWGTPSLPWAFGARWKLCAQKDKKRPKSNQKVRSPNMPKCAHVPRFSGATQRSPEVAQITQNPKSCPTNLKPKTLQLQNYRYCVP